MPIPGMTGGDSTPIIKYNAKARLWKVDDVPLNAITFVVDMDNAEAGWSRFAENSAPDFRMVRVADLLAGAHYPEAPDVRGADGTLLYRKGFRVQVKIPDKVAAGKPSVREFASNSFVTKRAFDALFDQWFAGRAANPDKLPVVQVKNYEEVAGKHGSNFAPIFELVRWIDRPADLGPKANGGAAPTAAATVEAVPDLDAPENFDDLDDDIPFA
jgi:hypothetical protein